MIEFMCIHCGKKLVVSDGIAGKKGKCPACGAINVVPGATGDNLQGQLPLESIEPNRVTAPLASSSRSFADPRNRARAGHSANPGTMIAIVALGVAVVALIVALFYNPGLPGKGLGSYDFSTPQAAVRSTKEIEGSGDMRAVVELQVAKAKAESDKLRSVVETLKCQDPIETDGKVLVLHEHKEGGLSRHESSWFEKKSDGRYYHTYVSTYGWNDESGDKPRIYRRIKEWEGKDQP